MDNNLIKRLRGLTTGYELEGSWRAIPAEAAAEIERLTKSNDVLLLLNADQHEEIERLRAALKGQP